MPSVTTIHAFEQQVFRDLAGFLDGHAEVFFADEGLGVAEPRNDGKPRVILHVQPGPADPAEHRGGASMAVQAVLQVDVFCRPKAQRRASDLDDYFQHNDYLRCKDVGGAIISWVNGRPFVDGSWPCEFVTSEATTYPIQNGEMEYAMSSTFVTTLHLEPNRPPEEPPTQPFFLGIQDGPPINEVTGWFGDDGEFEASTPQTRTAEEVDLYP